MLPIQLKSDGSVLRILAIGAHCDDLEIGAGGTLLELVASRPVHVDWIVLTSTPDRAAEAEASAQELLAGGCSSVKMHTFRDGFLPYEGAPVKEAFESLKELTEPDLILTHTRSDLHQDHRLANELTWNTFRDHLILEYEIPKYDGDLGQPNVFVAVSSEQLERKIKLVLEAYGTQTSKSWFDADMLRAIMRLRGVESNAPERHAEAFYGPKLTLDF